MWQIVNLEQDKFNFRPCLTLDMGLQPRIEIKVYSNPPIFSQFLLTQESNIEQFYKNEKYEKISYESRNVIFFIVLYLAVWSQ